MCACVDVYIYTLNIWYVWGKHTLQNKAYVFILYGRRLYLFGILYKGHKSSNNAGWLYAPRLLHYLVLWLPLSGVLLYRAGCMDA